MLLAPFLHGVNQPPVLQPIGNKTTRPGTSIRFQIQANDVDGQPLAFGSGPRSQEGFYVHPEGADTNPGSMALPFRTLDRAKAAVRTLKQNGMPDGGITVWLRGGIYERSTTFLLEAADSGSDALHPVRWMGFPGEQARIVGGTRVPFSAFSVVSSASPLWNRLDPGARGKVMQADLRALGILDFGVLSRRGFQADVSAGLELFVDGVPMVLGRWPDSNANTLQPDEQGDSIELFGASTPAVSGPYTKIGVEDGVSLFKRNQLSNGIQYHLFRRTHFQNGKWFRYWSIATATSGWAGADPANPYWSSRWDLGVFKPDANNSTLPTITARSPARVTSGWAHVQAPLAAKSFSYAGDRPSRWTQATDVWVAGMWGFHWADYHRKVASIDASARRITIDQPADVESLPFGAYGVAADQPWYAYNLPEEITVPGEYYLDRQSGILYLWPPAGFSSSTDVVVSLLESAVVKLSGVSHLELRDLVVEAGRTGLVDSANVRQVVLSGLTLRNSGTYGVALNGSDSVISRSVIMNCGTGAVRLRGGVRESLTPGNLRVEDCEVSYCSRLGHSGHNGISLSGCGNSAIHNEVHHAPQSAVDISGNNHSVAFNNIHHVCQSTLDSGAIYSGRDWGARGNVIANNYVHDLHSVFGGDINGIYLDDCVSGIHTHSNVIYAVDGVGIKAGGGRDSIIENNLIIRSGRNALNADARAYRMWQDGTLPPSSANPSWDLVGRLIALDYRGSTWASTFPRCALIPDTWAAVVAQPDEWLRPKGSVFARNLGWRNFDWINSEDDAISHFQSIAPNLPDSDPRFINEASRDLRLQPESPAYSLQGFQPIAFDRIGIRR